MNRLLVRLGIFIQRLGAYKESDPPKLKAEAEARMWRRSSGEAQVALQNETQRRLHYQGELRKSVSAVRDLIEIVENYEET